MSFLYVFDSFSMKNFARVMGLLFGSAGAHTYPKSGQVAPCTNIFHSLTVFCRRLCRDACR